MVIRLCVVADEGDVLREWLDAVDPLRFHFDVVAIVATVEEAQLAARGANAQTWVCRADRAPHLLASLQGQAGVVPRLVVLCADVAEASRAIGHEYQSILLDDESLWIFMAAVHAAARGQRFLSPMIIHHYHEVIADLIRPPDMEQLASLTPREVEVLLHLADGLSNAEISRRIFVSRATVSSHVLSLFRKIEVANRTEAAIFAVKNTPILRALLADGAVEPVVVER